MPRTWSCFIFVRITSGRSGLSGHEVRIQSVPRGMSFVTACHVAVGYPERPFPTKLTRSPVDEIVFAESFGTPLFS